MKSKKIVALALAGAIGVAGFWSWRRHRRSSRNERFKSVAVERGAIRVTVQATGTILPQNRLELKPPIAGRIETIRVQEGQRVRKGEILAWLSSTERAALLDAARAQGEKEAAYWEEAYKPTPLVSPMEGVIIARNMEPGQTVTTQDAPLVMSDRLIVKAQVDETDIGQLRLGQKADITLDAYPAEKIPGSVGHIAYESKTVSNVTIYEVDLLLQRVPAFMRAGMTANCTVVIRSKENVLVLPQEAVRVAEGESRVLVPAPEQENRKRLPKPVQTGISDGKRVEIVEGLAEGDTVLVPEIKWEKKDSGPAGGNPLMPFRPRPSGSRGGGSR